ncbi:hypothetical protein L873DRAFT_596225 [Choiromyces venosus 120613-1]|uniref:Uncharacterized protein n=1 Tax=Choiromyces venosus 120613-1 TaxID=1336337 RepID=A0A3N4JTR6_9PEZI|nr:hypothetical protein L873DRAFT_596225 [Choiromyces venosus 120613-1]
MNAGGRLSYIRNSTSPALAPTSDVDSRQNGSGTPSLSLSLYPHTLPVRRSHQTSSMICTVLYSFFIFYSQGTGLMRVQVHTYRTYIPYITGSSQSVQINIIFLLFYKLLNFALGGLYSISPFPHVPSPFGSAHTLTHTIYCEARAPPLVVVVSS